MRESTHCCLLETKKTLLEYAKNLSTRMGAEVGVMLFTPGGKPCSYASTSIDEVADMFFKVKLEDRQRNHAKGKSNIFDVFEDLQKVAQALEEREKQRTLMNKIMHPGLVFHITFQGHQSMISFDESKMPFTTETISGVSSPYAVC
ncbi:putative GDSL esterase/lipase-like [Capsicum annuum]|nr:putative GDSL esterase/lipase-like [Capsicum annuum]KAF3680836.1 putative GDSL esterase/lipase-like [Capsicum annuum]